jgi:hypothetical protein
LGIIETTLLASPLDFSAQRMDLGDRGCFADILRGLDGAHLR